MTSVNPSGRRTPTSPLVRINPTKADTPSFGVQYRITVQANFNLPSPFIGQVGKVLGERWKALSDKQRIPYETKAAADKKRYEEEKAIYMVCASTCFFLTQLPF